MHSRTLHFRRHELRKPLVTLYEVELACNPSRPWTGDYILDIIKCIEFQQDNSPMNGSVRALNLSRDLVNREFLNNCSWTGLQQNLGETNGESRSGMSSEYENETDLYDSRPKKTTKLC
uniref:Uncharacterized protein n=1 Tax=Strigamia maritima TaxID=126957 RepID=T1JIZ3_STRMM